MIWSAAPPRISHCASRLNSIGSRAAVGPQPPGGSGEQRMKRHAVAHRQSFKTKRDVHVVAVAALRQRAYYPAGQDEPVRRFGAAVPFGSRQTELQPHSRWHVREPLRADANASGAYIDAARQDRSGGVAVAAVWPVVRLVEMNRESDSAARS